jgi:hypothetical protein
MTIQAQVAEHLRHIAEVLDDAGVHYDGSQYAAIASGMFEREMLTVRKTDPASAEHRADVAGKRQQITSWLSANTGPTYNGERTNARSIGEILDAVGLSGVRGANLIARSVLESELTGWGLVGFAEGLRLYAKKATLIAFRPAA